MAADAVLGWDIGGAHLKVAAVNDQGRVMRVLQLPCPLWLGVEQLDEAIAGALTRMPAARLHAVTMTGELTDLFRNRAQGVKSIITRFASRVPPSRTYIYAGPSGFLTPASAMLESGAVASANWAASAQLVASLLPDALFVDIGSTTTDLVPIRGGRLGIRGYSDADRLACEELVYTGVVRTPIMALAERIPFEGNWIPAMAEYFATTADVYRLTAELAESADQLPAADNGSKTVRASARRLARMIGRDLESASLAQWKRCAHGLAELHLAQIQRACERVCTRAGIGNGSPMVGAGTGRFVVKKLAKRLGMRYRDFDSLVETRPAVAGCASSCAPAVAVALLAHEGGRK